MFKQVLFRLITYPFCLILIFLGFRMIFETSNYKYDFLEYKSAFSGFGIIIIVLVYLIADIIILLKKKFKQ